MSIKPLRIEAYLVYSTSHELVYHFHLLKEEHTLAFCASCERQYFPCFKNNNIYSEVRTSFLNQYHMILLFDKPRNTRFDFHVISNSKLLSRIAHWKQGPFMLQIGQNWKPTTTGIWGIAHNIFTIK